MTKKLPSVSSLTPEKAYARLLRRARKAALWHSIERLLSWDESTQMPSKDAPWRGAQRAEVMKQHHGLLAAARTGELLEKVKGSSLYKKQDVQAVVREMEREHLKAVKLPKRLVSAIAEATALAHNAWAEAREKSDFSLFAPELEKVLGLRKEEAGYLKEKGQLPYEVMIDSCEPYAKLADVSSFFAELKPPLVDLVNRIERSSVKPKEQLLRSEFPIEKQKELGLAAVVGLGYDPSRGRVDISTHPFCSGIGPNDVRITSRYDRNRFEMGFFAMIHEAGHAMYEQGLPLEIYGTPLAEFVSFAIHESQSRLWENFVARSGAFWDFFYPQQVQAFPHFAKVPKEEFVLAINRVQKSLIRVEADELTYNLHIILRFEVEKALFSGEIEPRYVPSLWNSTFRDLFGFLPPNDRVGCLQDIHWSWAAFGYFPTYTLGNLYAAQFLEKARADVGDLSGQWREGNFQPLLNWLRENIHSQGKRYTAFELCEKVTGKKLSAKPFLTYLKQKYGELYRI